MFTVEKVKLTKTNEPVFKHLFKANFPGQTWKFNVPFPKDPLYAAFDDTRDIVGFVFVHKEAPPGFTNAKGAFFYNLCTKKHGKGAGTAIITAIRADYPILHCHMVVGEPNHGWITNRGFVNVGVYNKKYVEYTAGDATISAPVTPIVIPDTIDTTHYDPNENVIYLS